VGAASSAALRFYAETSSSAGIKIQRVSDTTWIKNQITWDNAPAIGQVIATTGPLQAGNWYLVDVSSAVSGNGLISFAITNANSTGVTISSGESGHPPELYVPIPPSPDPFVVRRDGNTYYAESQTTSAAYTGTLKFVVERAAADLNVHGGGTITFLAGEFDLGATWFEFTDLKGVTFQGQGMDVTILRNNSSASTDTEPFDMTNADYITVRDMTVSAGGPLRSTSDALDFDAGDYNLVERVKVTGSRGRGIVFDGKDIHNGQPRTAVGNVILDCIVTGIPSDGIELLASSSNRVENCQVTNVGGHGIQMTKSSTLADQPNKKPNNNLIIGNFVDNAGQDGINLNSGDNNVITGNTILNSSNTTASQDGIDIASADSIACDDNVVQFNTATDNQAVKTQRYGLSISSANCHRTVVTNNDFAGNRVGTIRDLGTGTIYDNTPDTQPPTVPTGLATTLVTHDQVNLRWNASTDNVGVASYTIYRDGAVLNSVNSSTTTYQDSTVASGTTYAYTVEAFDAAGNGSGQSSSLPVTVPAAPTLFTFVPVADSYVNEGLPDRNYGNNVALRVDASPIVRSYLRFNVQGLGGAVTKATVRVYATTASTVGYDFRRVSNNSWGETTITYTNAPVVGQVLGSSGPFAGPTWKEFDVTVVITGNGTYSFALTTPHTTAINFASSEATANGPQLIIETAH
jgi:parallel beta-helix repeat protein